MNIEKLSTNLVNQKSWLCPRLSGCFRRYESKMKNSQTIIAVLLSMFIASICVAGDIVIIEGEREINLREGYLITTCGSIGLAECPSCIDSSSYYFNIETKQLISRCGGACWHPREEQEEVCKTLCPPPQWECNNNS